MKLCVSGSSSVHRQEFIHCTLAAGICHTGLKTAFEQDHSILVLLENCLQTYMTYTSAECTVNPDDGQRNCPKHVEFHAGANLRNWCIWLVLL